MESAVRKFDGSQILSENLGIHKWALRSMGTDKIRNNYQSSEFGVQEHLVQDGILLKMASCSRWHLAQDGFCILLKMDFRVEANDGNNTGNGKFAHLAASSRT